MLRICVLLLGLLACGPNYCLAQNAGADLGKRIGAATAERECHPGEPCSNPQIIADERALRVILGHGTPSDIHIPVGFLEQYLTSLPLSDWPEGPNIFIMQTDVISGPNHGRDRIKNGELAKKICAELGLSVKLGQGVWKKETLKFPAQSK